MGLKPPPAPPPTPSGTASDGDGGAVPLLLPEPPAGAAASSDGAAEPCRSAAAAAPGTSTPPPLPAAAPTRCRFAAGCGASQLWLRAKMRISHVAVARHGAMASGLSPPQPPSCAPAADSVVPQLLPPSSVTERDTSSELPPTTPLAHLAAVAA
eukprot:335894-Chlamydomonas_euryale.AAC.2